MSGADSERAVEGTLDQSSPLGPNSPGGAGGRKQDVVTGGKDVPPQPEAKKGGVFSPDRGATRKSGNVGLAAEEGVPFMEGVES